MNVTAFCAAAGVGKTQLFTEKIANDMSWQRVEVYVPTHALAKEWKKSILKHAPTRRVQIIAGRERPGADGKPLCTRHAAASQISKAGYSVYSRLCSPATAMPCPDWPGCSYISQFCGSDVFIYTHAHLSLDRGMLDKNMPDFVVIDESFFSACLSTIEFHVSLLRHDALPQAARTLCASVAGAMQAGLSLHPVIAPVRRRGGGLRAAIKALGQCAPKTQLHQSDQQILQVISSTPNFDPVAKLLEHLASAFEHKQTLESVDYDAATGQVVVHHRNDITRFTQRSQLRTPPQIYLLDATASQEITEAFFPGADFQVFRSKRKAFVVQCRSSVCSTRSLNPSVHAEPYSASAAAQKLSEVQKLIDELSGNGKKLLVVGPTAITGNPGKSLLPLVNVLDHCALAHFSALRGVDVWKDFDTVLVIGRNQPPPKAVEDMARGLFYDDAVPLQIAGQWSRQPRGYRLIDALEGVDVDVHPDARVQAVLEQVRESETLQAIDRLRLIYCDEPKLVVLLSNIPLDLDVDALLTWDELIYGSRLEQAWLAAAEVMPLSPDWLAEAHSDLWPTAAAAKKDVQRQARKGQITNRFSIYKMSPFAFEYRVPGQRRASYCLSRVADPDAVSTALIGLLGVPVRVNGPLPDPPG